MALTIGGIDFEVNANTAGLQKALARIQKFEAAVNKASRSQLSGSQASARALGKQESALKKAYEKTVKLQTELRKSGANANEISKVTGAFKKLTTQLTEGELNSVRYTRAMDAFNIKLARSRSTIVKAGKSMENTTKKGHKLTEVLRNLESASVLAIGPLSGLGARIRSVGAIFSRSTLLFAAAFAGISGVIIGIGKLAIASVKAGADFERTFARFKAGTTSLALASKEFIYITDLSKKLGLELTATAASYSRFTAAAQGTALEGKAAQEVFEGISYAAAGLRLDNQSLEGTFRAIEQMMSKGTIQAEELRGQLGDRLVGAFNKAAEAMGVTTVELNRMLKAGEVLSEDFLPKFAALYKKTFGAAALDNVNSLTGSVNKLTNAWYFLKLEFDDTTGAGDKTTAVLRWAAWNVEGFTIQLAILRGVFKGLGKSFDEFYGGNYSDIFGNIGTAVGASTDRLDKLRIKAEDAEDALSNLGKNTQTRQRIKTLFKPFLDSIAELRTQMKDKALESINNNFYGRVTKPLEDYTTRINQATRIHKSAREYLIKTYEELLVKDFDNEEADKAGAKARAGARKTIAAFTTLDAEIQGLQDNLANLKLSPEALEELQRFSTPFEKFIAKAKKLLASGAIEQNEYNQYLFDFALGLKDVNAQLDVNAAKLKASQDAIDAGILLDKQTAALAKFEGQITTLQSKLKALNAGPQATDNYTRITKPLEKFTADLEASIAKGDLHKDHLIRLRAELKKVLTEIANIEDANASVSAANAQAQAVAKLGAEITTLRHRLEGLNSGPIAQDFYERLIKPYDAFKKQLEDAVAKQRITYDQAKLLAQEYENYLRKIVDAENAITGAAEQAGNAIVNSLENMIFTATSAKDALKDLGRELIKIALRAAVFDPLSASINQIFSQFSLPGVGGPPTPAISGVPTGYRPLSDFAYGGSFKVGGSGGTDSSLVAFNATPGEQVTVNTPAQQRGSSGGDPINITINAPGADTGTIARITEIVRTEMVPGIIAASTASTALANRRPRFA